MNEDAFPKFGWLRFLTEIIYIYIYIYTHTHTHTHTQKCYIYIDKYTHLYKLACTHTHTHTHTHTRIANLSFKAKFQSLIIVNLSFNIISGCAFKWSGNNLRYIL